MRDVLQELTVHALLVAGVSGALVAVERPFGQVPLEVLDGTFGGAPTVEIAALRRGSQFLQDAVGRLHLEVQPLGSALELIE